jgi:hypothetical protein
VTVDWVTYRRGKLAPVTAPVKYSWVKCGDQRTGAEVADEVVDIDGYGKARQLTLYEKGTAVLQVVTSDMTSSGAAVCLWLRGRWSIENLFKYGAAHNGIDSISSYLMETGPDDRVVANPARKAQRARVAAAEAALAAAERALAQALCDTERSAEEINAATAGLHSAIEKAWDAVADDKEALKKVPAKVPPPISTQAQSAPRCAWSAVGCRWCAGSSPSTRRPGSPNISTSTWATPTRTGR